MLEPILHLKDWMSPEHCTPDEWFRIFVILCGGYVSIIYFIFAYWVKTKLKITLRILIQNKFPHYLGWVFIFCGITHGLHSFAYLNQYLKLGLFISYPALVYFHTMLLISSKKAIENIASLKTHQELILLENENKVLKEKLKKLE